jgi:hypothetical protein
MQKIVTLFSLLFLALATFASSIVVAPATKTLRASELMIPVANQRSISLLDLANMSPKEYAVATGKHMNVFDKMKFRLAQKELRKTIREDGTVDQSKMAKLQKKMAAASGFHLGGFALGFFLGPIGVLIAYLINDDLKSERTKWAWIGLIAWVVIFVLVL